MNFWVFRCRKENDFWIIWKISLFGLLKFCRKHWQIIYFSSFQIANSIICFKKHISAFVLKMKWYLWPQLFFSKSWFFQTLFYIHIFHTGSKALVALHFLGELSAWSLRFIESKLLILNSKNENITLKS